MEIQPFLETARLILAPLGDEHCTTRYLNWLYDPEVNFYLHSGEFPQSIDCLKDFVRECNLKPGLFLAIHTKDTSTHIGNIKIDALSWTHRTAEYGILMGDKTQWNKGFAKEASQATITHCFDRLNLRKITLGVIEENENAVRLYEKLGFVTEGLLRQQVYCQGDYSNVLRMGLLKEEWQSPKK